MGFWYWSKKWGHLHGRPLSEICAGRIFHPPLPFFGYVSADKYKIIGGIHCYNLDSLAVQGNLLSRARFTQTWLHYVQVFATANPSVCNVRALYSGGWNFRQYLFAFCTLAILLIDLPAKFYGDRPRGTLPSGALRARGVAKQSDVAFGYLISWWVSCMKQVVISKTVRSY